MADCILKLSFAVKFPDESVKTTGRYLILLTSKSLRDIFHAPHAGLILISDENTNSIRTIVMLFTLECDNVT